MANNSTLKLVFETSGGSKKTLSLKHPDTDINDVQVRTAMTGIIDKDVFVSKNGKYVAPSAAYIETVEIKEFDVN